MASMISASEAIVIVNKSTPPAIKRKRECVRRFYDDNYNNVILLINNGIKYACEQLCPSVTIVINTDELYPISGLGWVNRCENTMLDGVIISETILPFNNMTYDRIIEKANDNLIIKICAKLKDAGYYEVGGSFIDHQLRFTIGWGTE